MDGGQHQQDYQKDYFQTIIKQYEIQNAQFREKQCNLRHRLEAIECSMPALLCFNMMQGKNKQTENAEYDRNPVKEQPSSSSQKENRNFKNTRNDINLRSCDCNLCPINADFDLCPKIPKITKAPSINIRNDINMRSCKCNPCPLIEGVKNISPPAQNILSSTPTDTTYQNKTKPPFENVTAPNDVQYIAKIKGLVVDERNLKEEIEELEHRERIYFETLKQTHERPSNEIGYNGEGDFEIQALKRINQELEANNKTLEEELEEVKKEIKYIQDSVEEPMRRELENERRNYMDLDEKFRKKTTDIANRESSHQKKVIFLERQIQSASRNLDDLHVVNKRLKEELCMLNCRYNELQTDLINQKLSEIHTISRMTAAQDKVTYQPPLPKPVLSLSGIGSDEDLNNIARNLSKLLQEATACSNCVSAHPDLIDTVQYIKDLVEIVNKDKKQPKKFDKDSFVNIYCKCVDMQKLRAEMGAEESDEQPTHEILSPKKILSGESTSTATAQESKLATRISVSGKKPSKIDDDKVVRSSATMAAKSIQDLILSQLVSDQRIEDTRSVLEEKASIEIAPEKTVREESARVETVEEEIIESEAPTDTEDTEAVTDFTVSASATEEIVTESEPLTETTELESEEPVTDTEEQVDLPEESVAEQKEDEEGTELKTEIIEDIISPVALLPTEREPEKLYDDEELGDEKQMEDTTAEVIDKKEEIIPEDSQKLEGGKEDIMETEPKEEVEILETPKSILEDTEEDITDRKEEVEILESAKNISEGTEEDIKVSQDDEEKETAGEDVTDIDDRDRKEEMSSENAKITDGEQDIVETGVNDLLEREDITPSKSTEKPVEITQEDTSLKLETEELGVELKDDVPRGEPESETKDSVKSIPVTEHETVADIVRTICRCVRRDEPQLCDCPIERKKSKEEELEPKIGFPDKIEGTILPDEVESAAPPDGTEDGAHSEKIEDSTPLDETQGASHPDEIEDGAPLDEIEGSTHLAEIIGDVPPDETEGVVYPEVVEGGVPSDKTEGGVRPDEIEDGALRDKSKIEEVSSKQSIPASKESSKKSIPPENVAIFEEEKIDSKISPKSEIEHLLATDTHISKEEQTLIEEGEPTSLPKPGIGKASSDVLVRSPLRSKPTSREPSTRSLPLEGARKISDSPITPTEISKKISEKSLPKEEIPTKYSSKSKPTSKEPSLKSVPEDVSAKPISSTKLGEEIVETRTDSRKLLQSREKIVSREPSVKIDEQVVRGESRLSRKESSKASSKEIMLQSSTTENKVEAPMSAEVKAEAEGNVPTETDVELITKSSDGVYVTTTVTSSGHVEVTTEGPTGVVETTLKVTESGNLEVTTGLTEYDKSDDDSAKEAKSDHSKDDDITEIEVIHAPVRDMKESQDALDIQESSKLSEHASDVPASWEEEEAGGKSVEKVIGEGANQLSDGVLGVIKEEEEIIYLKEKEFIEVECQYEDITVVGRPLEQEPPPVKRYCECPPPLVICECEEDVDESEEQQVKDGIAENNVEERSDVILIKENELVEVTEPTSIMKSKDEISSLRSGEISPKRSNEPLAEKIKSVEIMKDVLSREPCYIKDSDEFEYEEVVSGSTLSDVSLFDDLTSNHSHQFKKQTSESSHTRSLIIEEPLQYQSDERAVRKPVESAKPDKTSKSILKHTESSNYEENSNATVSIIASDNASSSVSNNLPNVKQESASATTSTSDLKFSTCACEEDVTSKREAKEVTPNQEEDHVNENSEEKRINRKQKSNQKQDEEEENRPKRQEKADNTDSQPKTKAEDRYGNTTVNNLKIIICNRDSCKTYSTEEESLADIPKCECARDNQRQLPRICNRKTCGTSSKSRQVRKDKSNEKDVSNKLLLENATCTTCDKTSCQVIKSRTQYVSSESVISDDNAFVYPDTYYSAGAKQKSKKQGISADDAVPCPDTCSSVGVQHISEKQCAPTADAFACPETCSSVGVQYTSKRQNIGFICPKSCDNFRKRDTDTDLNEKKIMSYPRNVCTSSCSGLDDQKVCPPSCKEKGVQETSHPKRSLKSHFTNTPKSSKTCKLDICDSMASDQRTVSTYYSCNPVNLVQKEVCSPSECNKRFSNVKSQTVVDTKTGSDSPMVEIQKLICDPNACKKGVSIKERPKSPSAPQVTRTCNSRTCKTDAYTDYKSESLIIKKTSIIKQSGSEKLQNSKKCECVKPPEKSDATTETEKEPTSNTVVDEESNSIMETACTSLTCSVLKIDRSVKGQTSSRKSSEAYACSSATCSAMKVGQSVKSHSSTPSSIVSDKIPCSSATCSGLKVNKSIKSRTPSSIGSDKIPCSSATCSGLKVNQSIRSETLSSKSSGTNPCTSITCTALQSLSSQESKCISATCLNRTLESVTSKPASIKSSGKKIDKKKSGSAKSEEEICDKCTAEHITSSKSSITSSEQNVCRHCSGMQHITPDSSKQSLTSSKKSDTSPPSSKRQSKPISPESSKKSNLSTPSTKKSDKPSETSNEKRSEKDEADVENVHHSPKVSQDEMSGKPSLPSEPGFETDKNDTQSRSSKVSGGSFENRQQPIEKYKPQEVDESPVKPMTVEDLETEIRTWDHIDKPVSNKDGSESDRKFDKTQRETPSSSTKGSSDQDLKKKTSKTQPRADVKDSKISDVPSPSKIIKLQTQTSKTQPKADVEDSEISDIPTSSKIIKSQTEPGSSEIVKFRQPSTGDVPKSPKSASRYTITEKLPSISDHREEKTMKKPSQSSDQDRVTTARDVLSRRSSKSEEEVSSSPSHEKEITKDSSVYKKEIQDSTHSGGTPPRKSSGSIQSEGKSSEKASKRSSKESGIEKQSSKAKKDSTAKSSEISVKDLEQKSTDKLPLPSSKPTSKSSIKSSKSSICQPCGKIHGKASGDIISQDIKKPPDKDSKSSIHSTESEKRSKSKIPVPVQKTSSQLKEKHQGDCACMECLTQEKEKEGHPPDCDCVDCLCQPSKFVKKLSNIVEVEKEREQLEHSLSCTCIDCLCQPKTEGEEKIKKDFIEAEDKPKHSPSCNCVDCLCAPSDERGKLKGTIDIEKPDEKHIGRPEVKEIERPVEKTQELVYTCPSLPPTKRHHPDCKCSKCVCDPCSHAPGCSCKLCICDPCKDEIVQFKKHPPDCTCLDCLCAPCGDKRVEEEKGKHPPQCNCSDCLCEPCSDKEVQKTKERLKHPPECNCSDCVCEPCGDPEIQKKKDALKQHPKDCRCPKCVCDPCNDENIEAKKKEKHVEDGDCTCEECVCDPCDDPKVVRAKKGCIECGCLICICDPCEDPKIVAQKKPHPPSCNCVECLCDPCNDPTKSKAHGPNCTCNKCVCQPCKSDGEHGPDCKCPICVCETCPDPVKKKSIHGPDCKCRKCLCQPCKSDVKEHGPNCNCPTCTCNPCLDPTKKRSLHGLDCTCPRCECDKEAGEPIQTHSPNCCCSVCKHAMSTETPKPVESKKSLHGPDCTCEKCIHDTSEQMEQLPELHSANCKCSVCKQKILKPRPVELKKPSHGLDCTCEKCTRDSSKKIKQLTEGHNTNCKCSMCTDKMPNETLKANFVDPPEKHSPSCKCTECKHSRSTSKETTKSKPAARQIELPDIPEECPECDCSPICICDNCPAQRNNTAPVPKKMKDEALKKNIKDIEKENVRREKDMKEIEKLMKQIRCACTDAEKQAARTTPPEATLIQRTDSFKNTLSGLQIAMNTLQDKCKVKDKMIEAMTQELRLRANSNIFNDMFRNMAGLPPVNVDFDMHEICDSLPRPTNDPRYGRPSYRYAEGTDQNTICSCESGSLSMQITNVKQISPNSILVRWSQPANDQVIGYEVMVENVLKSRIHSAQRTSAVVFTIAMKNKLNISVYALTQFGRCEPPATCIYG